MTGEPSTEVSCRFLTEDVPLIEALFTLRSSTRQLG